MQFINDHLIGLIVLTFLALVGFMAYAFNSHRKRFPWKYESTRKSPKYMDIVRKSSYKLLDALRYFDTVSISLRNSRHAKAEPYWIYKNDSQIVLLKMISEGNYQYCILDFMEFETLVMMRSNQISYACIMMVMLDLNKAGKLKSTMGNPLTTKIIKDTELTLG